MTNTFLTFRRGVSKGNQTYGYSIITLTDTNTGKKYQDCAQGLELGVVLAQWLRDGSGKWESICALPAKHNDQQFGYHGLTAYNGKRGIDGKAGLLAMQIIGQAVGLCIEEVYDKTRNKDWHLLGIKISEMEQAQCAA